MEELKVSITTEWGHKLTFARVPAADIHALDSHDVVIFGSPIYWGTTHRPGARFGPGANRGGDCMAFDGKRPHLPTGIDPLAELEHQSTARACPRQE